MIRRSIILSGLLVGAALFGSGLWMGGKAVVAQVLLEHTWHKSVKTGKAVSPWSSMDAQIMGRLSVPSLNKDVVVFDRTSGQALAFGPTHLADTSLPGTPGTTAIAAHKNTHFDFLKVLKPGATIEIDTLKGETAIYRVRETEIINVETDTFSISEAPDAPPELALITCYPFDSVSFGGPLRYIVWADFIRIQTFKA